MLRTTILFSALSAPILLAGCTATGSATSASASKGQIVSISPEVRAELERKGLNPDEEVCRREAQMGSTIPKRTCATRAAWEAKRQASRQGLEDGQRNSLQTRDPNAG